MTFQSESHNRQETPTPAPRPNPSSPGNAETSSLARYAAHWLLPGADDRYALSRDPKRYRHWAHEEALVGRWLRRCEPGALVLDLPCGTGRFTDLVHTCGHRLISADLSWQMVYFAGQHAPAGCYQVCCDLATPSFQEGSIDIVLCWRIFHHFRTDEHRRTALLQLRRLARRYVILSYYNRHCVTYWTRRFVRGVLRRPPKCTGAIWTSRLIALAKEVGLRPVEIHHYRPGISINSAVCLAVEGSTAS